MAWHGIGYYNVRRSPFTVHRSPTHNSQPEYEGCQIDGMMFWVLFPVDVPILAFAHVLCTVQPGSDSGLKFEARRRIAKTTAMTTTAAATAAATATAMMI